MAKKHKVIYDRETCIGAMACVAACPKQWEMNDDGKADLLGSKQNTDTRFFELEIEDNELEENEEAAEVCPVDAIKVIRKEKS